MAAYDEELIKVAEGLLVREPGQAGLLPRARIRRSVSSAYYALFHFLLEEIGLKIVGTHGNLLERRRIFARTITHLGAKTALSKVRGAAIDRSVEDMLRPTNAGTGSVSAPTFAKNLANAFIDAQAKREEADYDLNAKLSEGDARLMTERIKRAVADWRNADTDPDRDFKHALCLLIALKGKLRES